LLNKDYFGLLGMYKKIYSRNFSISASKIHLALAAIYLSRVGVVGSVFAAALTV
jgi:hypothetical protein